MEIRVQNSWCQIRGDIPAELIALLSYVDKQRTFQQTRWEGKWSPVVKCLINQRRKVFPTGLLPLVVAKFPTVTLLDERSKLEVEWQPFPPEMSYKKGHQATALQAMIDNQRGTIDGITAMGKSYLEAGFASIFEHPLLIISHRKEIAQNIISKCQELVGEDDVGFVFSNKVSLKRVVVGMIGSLHAKMDDLKEWMQSLRAILIDESHHCSVGSQYYEFVQKCENAYFRFGLTATPWREAGDTIAVFALTGPVIFSYPYKQGVEEGVVVPIEVFVSPVSPNQKMPILDSFTQVYERGVVYNEERNEQIEKIVRHLHNKGENVLVLVWRRVHGTLISENILDLPHDYVHGSTPWRFEAKTKFESGELPILIASSIYDEGVDIERVQNVIIAAGYRAPRLLIQRVGRGMRPFKGKTKCRVFDFIDTCHSTLLKHSKERIKFFKKMGFKIKELHV